MRDDPWADLVADDQRDGQLPEKKGAAPSDPRNGLLRLCRPSPLCLGGALRVATDRATDPCATVRRVPGCLCLPSGTQQMVSGHIQQRRRQAVPAANVGRRVFAGGA